ncbi:unnamed protein product, partial [Prorocentrum cordatum]
EKKREIAEHNKNKREHAEHNKKKREHASKDEENRRLAHPTLGILHATFGSKATYYCYTNLETNKKVLLVEVSSKLTERHAEACVELCKQSCKRNLDKQETVALRSKGDIGDVSQMRALFTRSEIQQLHNKFRNARQENDRAQQVFDTIEAKGHRVGKNEAKQKLLASWIKDPEMKKGLWKVVLSVETGESATRKSVWKTKKQMDLKYTGSEIEEMIENGS